MKSIVKNCPACIISPSCCAKYHIDNGHAKDCQDIADCVIKQVIEKCKLFQNNYLVNNGVQMLTINILNSFDIEEINK